MVGINILSMVFSYNIDEEVHPPLADVEARSNSRRDIPIANPLSFSITFATPAFEQNVKQDHDNVHVLLIAIPHVEMNILATPNTP